MAKIFILLLLPVCLTACAQETAKHPPGPEQFQSKYVKLIKDTAVMMLIQNVVIHYGDLYMEADSALLDKPNRTITGFGVRKAGFKGVEIKSLPEKSSIKYTKGSNKWELAEK